jgi:myosin heavy subunit
MLELLKSIAEKAGVANTPEYIQWAASPELQAVKDLQLPEEIVKAFNQNLINIETAKTHKDIRKAIKGEELGKVDEAIKAVAKEIGMSEEELTEIMSSGTTDQKTVNAIKKAVLHADKSKSTASERERKLAEQIAEQSKAFNEFKKLTEDEKLKYQNEITGVKKNYALKTALMQHSLRDDLDREDLSLITESKLNRFLAEKKAQLVLTPSGGLEIMDAEEPNTPWYDKDAGSHRKFADIFPKLLADNKLLKVSEDPNKNKQSVTTGSPARNNPVTPYDAQLADLIKQQVSA